MYYLIPNPIKRAIPQTYPPEEGVKYLQMEELPKRPPNRIGFTVHLYADTANNTAWWEYAPIAPEEPTPPSPPEPTTADRLQAIEQAIIEMAGEIYG